MPLRDGFFSTATQTSCCNRIQRSNRVRLLVVSTHDFPDKMEEADKVEVASGVALASLRRFRAALIEPTQGLPKRRRLCV